MEILSLIFEVRFEQKASLIVNDKRQTLIELITGNPPKTKPPDAPQMGMALNHKQSKTRVVTEENRLAISVEFSQIPEVKEQLIKTLDLIYGEIKYKNCSITRIGMRTKWMSAWNRNFTSLLKSFKEQFFLDNSLLQDSSDVGVALTLADNGFKVNYSAGPMKSEQGKLHLIFKKRELPHDFVFIDIDRYKESGEIENSIVAIKGFISDSITYGENKAKETVEILEGGSDD